MLNDESAKYVPYITIEAPIAESARRDRFYRPQKRCKISKVIGLETGVMSELAVRCFSAFGNVEPGTSAEAVLMRLYAGGNVARRKLRVALGRGRPTAEGQSIIACNPRAVDKNENLRAAATRDPQPDGDVKDRKTSGSFDGSLAFWMGDVASDGDHGLHDRRARVLGNEFAVDEKHAHRGALMRLRAAAPGRATALASARACC